MIIAIVTEIDKYNYIFINIKHFININQTLFYNYKVQLELIFYIFKTDILYNRKVLYIYNFTICKSYFILFYTR